MMLACDQPDLGKRYGRPDLPAPCLANDDGTCFRRGEELEVVNMECTESDNVTDAYEYMLKLERMIYACQKDYEDDEDDWHR
jgi:hypothetical protein